MSFSEAKEHAPGRLHALLGDPYQAFDNDQPEKRESLVTALQALLAEPLAHGKLQLRVIHGWENGSFELEDLRHSDHQLHRLDDMSEVLARYNVARERLETLPSDNASLLATPLADAIEQAEQAGQQVDEETRRSPARWPAFANGLMLYTFFKIYHRLTYDEDDAYRSIRCETPSGSREIHEFHLTEGGFAICLPLEPDSQDSAQLTLHESQLEPVTDLLKECL